LEYFVSEVSSRKGTGKKMHHVLSGVNQSFSPPSPRTKFYVPLFTPSKEILSRKELPLFPSRGRFTLIQVNPPRRVALIDGFEFSTLLRHARTTISRPLRRKLKSARATLAKFTSLSFPISAAFISSNSDDRGIDIFIPSVCSLTYPAKPRAVCASHTQNNVYYVQVIL